MVCFLFAQSNTVCKRFAYGLLFVCTCQTRFVCSLLMVFSVYSKLAPPPNSKVDSSTHLLIRCGRVVPERAPWQRQRRRPAVTVGASQPPAGAAVRRGYRGTGLLSGAAAKRAGPGRCRLDPVELNHHLTLPNSRESLELGVERRKGLRRRSGARHERRVLDEGTSDSC
jgi:hypothetical protein